MPPPPRPTAPPAGPCCSLAVTRGALRSLGDEWTVEKASWVSALIAVGSAIFTAVVVLPLLKWRMSQQDQKAEADLRAAEANKDV